MKRITILVITVIMAAIGVNQAMIRKNVLADAVYIRQTDYYHSEGSETFPCDNQNLQSASTIPATLTKYYNIPLSAELQQFIADNARNLDIRLIIAVIWSESNFDETAVNGDCMGLMQIKKSENEDRMKRLGVTDLFDPQGNILVGVDYLSELVGKYGIEKGLTAYRWGPNASIVKTGTSKYARTAMEYMEVLK